MHSHSSTYTHGVSEWVPSCTSYSYCSPTYSSPPIPSSSPPPTRTCVKCNNNSLLSENRPTPPCLCVVQVFLFCINDIIYSFLAVRRRTTTHKYCQPTLDLPPTDPSASPPHSDWRSLDAMGWDGMSLCYTAIAQLLISLERIYKTLKAHRLRRQRRIIRMRGMWSSPPAIHLSTRHQHQHHHRHQHPKFLP